MLNAVAAGGESAVTMLAFERFLSGMHPQMQLQIWYACKFAATFMELFLLFVIFLTAAFTSRLPHRSLNRNYAPDFIPEIEYKWLV